MAIIQGPTPSPTDAIPGVGNPEACSEAVKAAGKCSAEASDAGGHIATAHATLDSHHCKDLPNCTISHSTTDTVGPLIGMIGKEMSVTQLMANGVFLGSEAASGKDKVEARNRATDKVTNLVVEPAKDGTSAKANFLVKANGVVEVVNNIDSNKDNTVRIAFEPTAGGDIKSEQIALNVLTQFIKDGYGTPTTRITDTNNMVVDYLKSPVVEPYHATTLSQGIGHVPYIPREQAGPGGGYSGGINTQPYGGAPFARTDAVNGYSPLANLFAGMRNWNAELNPERFSPTIDPFELTAFSVLDWLADIGIDLGNPPDPARLEKAIKILDKEDHKLAEVLKSDKFTNLIHTWHDTGKPPSPAELANALPNSVRTDITHELKEKYASLCKGQNGQVDWGKVDASTYFGHVASAQEVQLFEHSHETGFGELPPPELAAQIKEGLSIAHQDPSDANVENIWSIVRAECGGRPRPNEQGTSACGWLQFINSTWSECSAPGYGDRYNLRDCTIALVNYLDNPSSFAHTSHGIPNLGFQGTVAMLARDAHSGYWQGY